MVMTAGLLDGAGDKILLWARSVIDKIVMQIGRHGTMALRPDI